MFLKYRGLTYYCNAYVRFPTEPQMVPRSHEVVSAIALRYRGNSYLLARYGSDRSSIPQAIPQNTSQPTGIISKYRGIPYQIR